MVLAATYAAPSEAHRSITAVGMIDTGLGFRGHRLEFSSPRRRRLHGAIFQAALEDKRVQQGFGRFTDRGIINHCAGVGWLALGIAAEMGLDEDLRALRIVATSSLMHDVLKNHEIIYPAVTSKLTFTEAPRNFQIVQHHAVWGGIWMRQNGFTANEAMCVASHHGFQTQRPAYGILAENVRAFPEKDGYVPPTVLCAAALAVADVFHARTAPPEDNGRYYGLVPNAEDGLEAVYSLKTDVAVKDAAARITGFAGLNVATVV